MMTVDPDLRYGLPIMRARFGLVTPDLWRPALIASKARADPVWPDKTPPQSWRLEVFVPPVGAPGREPWGSWAGQHAEPLFKAEAERQNTFYSISLELGRRLLAGELRGFGRSGSIAGPWIEIPAEAWHLLRVPQADGFINWHVGHLVGAGLDLWGVRILDTVGLPRNWASIAYGPTEHAQIALRAEAFGIICIRERVGGKTNLGARMAEWTARHPLGLGAQDMMVKQGDHQAACQALDEALQRLIDEKALVAVAAPPHVLIRPQSVGHDTARPAPEVAKRLKAPRAKPKGISYRDLDQPLIDEMRRMLTANPPIAKGEWEAALVVSEKAAGTGTGESKAKRLQKLYSDTFRD